MEYIKLSDHHFTPRPPVGKTQRRRKPWTLAKVHQTCRSAPAVWVALGGLAAANGSRLVTPTREQLANATGIRRHKTISTALTALERAAWIDRTHVPVTVGGLQTATLLRIVLLGEVGTAPRKGRKTPQTARSAVQGAKRPKGRGRKSPQDSLREREAPRAAVGEAAAGTPTYANEHERAEGQGRPIADVLAEALGDG